MVKILRRLWRGEYRLPIAFWGFYVVGYLCSYGLVVLIAPLLHSQPWRGLSVFLLIVPYNVASTVGVWRSADAYVVTRWWPRFTQLAVVLWEARIGWSMANGMLATISETMAS